jgi:mono/diheme cytochrome c family protein
VARGQAIYRNACASCHGWQDGDRYIFEGKRLGQVEPIANVATDQGRLEVSSY